MCMYLCVVCVLCWLRHTYDIASMTEKKMTNKTFDAIMCVCVCVCVCQKQGLATCSIRCSAIHFADHQVRCLVNVLLPYTSFPFLSVYVCVCVCTCACACLCVHACVCTCACACLCVHVHMSIDSCVCLYFALRVCCVCINGCVCSIYSLFNRSYLN